MPQSVINLPAGGTATIKGTPAEIAEVLRLLGATTSRNAAPRKNARLPEASPKRSAKKGPQSYTLELKNDGFFQTERSLGDVQQALRVAGHIYSVNDISPALVRLVRRKELGRIKGKSGKWAYVAR